MFFQIKKKATQSDQADRRYIGLKSGVLNKTELGKLIARILRYVLQNTVRRLHLLAAFLNFQPLKRCFHTCSKVKRIAKLTELYFLSANFVNVHHLPDF